MAVDRLRLEKKKKKSIICVIIRYESFDMKNKIKKKKKKKKHIKKKYSTGFWKNSLRARGTSVLMCNNC